MGDLIIETRSVNNFISLPIEKTEVYKNRKLIEKNRKFVK